MRQLTFTGPRPARLRPACAYCGRKNTFLLRYSADPEFKIINGRVRRMPSAYTCWRPSHRRAVIARLEALEQLAEQT